MRMRMSYAHSYHHYQKETSGPLHTLAEFMLGIKCQDA